jgi:hypothetical protein
LERSSRVAAWADRRCSFLAGLPPPVAVSLSTSETLEILGLRLGDLLETALTPEPAVDGPTASEPNGRWLRTANVVGVNIRTVGNVWNVVKYALTLSAAQDAIHLLPIWEPGVVGSLYAMASWNLSPELFSPELAALRPELDTPDKQLAVVVNVLHALGRSVGIDVIPHTDRFAEIVLANPSFFEWLQRRGTSILDHSADLHEAVQERIRGFLNAAGPAAGGSGDPFADENPEPVRLRMLFGEPEDRAGRLARRRALVSHLVAAGYETVPATMAPPYRGLRVDARETGRILDEDGHEWRDYEIVEPQPMSRVFGPLTRYKLYDRLDDNTAWQIDFSRPRTAVWDYVTARYAAVQRRFGFDFMRGDMSHVQMRPDGVPSRIDEQYDLLRAVKRTAQREAPHFAYFAESFLAEPDVMAYGDEVEHLDASEAEVALGDLQSTVVGSEGFRRELARYRAILERGGVAPSFTVMTADKDDPRFDRFYLRGNALRFFAALFLGDMPSYVGLGFECRDRHEAPAPNEHYTKLYVFQERSGAKATRGPYVWGRNAELFNTVTRIKLQAERLLPRLRGRRVLWLRRPDDAVPCWRHARTNWLFVASTDLAAPRRIELPEAAGLVSLFSTAEADPAPGAIAASGELPQLEPGECRIYGPRAGADPA